MRPPDFSLNSTLIRMQQLYRLHGMVQNTKHAATEEQKRVLTENIQAEFDYLKELILEEADKRLAREQQGKK